MTRKAHVGDRKGKRRLVFRREGKGPGSTASRRRKAPTNSKNKSSRRNDRGQGEHNTGWSLRTQSREMSEKERWGDRLQFRRKEQKRRQNQRRSAELRGKRGLGKKALKASGGMAGHTNRKNKSGCHLGNVRRKTFRQLGILSFTLPLLERGTAPGPQKKGQGHPGKN